MRQEASPEALDAAFASLERFTRGDDPAALQPIEQAVREVHGSAAARAALEQRLARHLAAPASDAARTFVCRELAVIGSPASVPAIAALLTNDNLSYMARYALERIPGPEADRALRDALPRARGHTRIGIIASLGARRDARSVPLLTRILADDPASAAAAARALGEIGTPEAARALYASRDKRDEEVHAAVADAMLMSAERLLVSGERAHAVTLLEALTDSTQPPHVRLAARQALSAARRP